MMMVDDGLRGCGPRGCRVGVAAGTAWRGSGPCGGDAERLAHPAEELVLAVYGLAAELGAVALQPGAAAVEGLGVGDPVFGLDSQPLDVDVGTVHLVAVA